MSPLRLTGSTSGYSQIDAPAVAGDQTFTLPGTGGTLDRLNRAGNILQVVSATKTDTASFTSSTFTDITGLSATITPSAATNKILVMYQVFTGYSVGTSGAYIRLVRDSTAICIADSASNRVRMTSGTYTVETNAAATYQTGAASQGQMFLDSPATTSSITYKLQLGMNSGATLYVNRSIEDRNTSSYDPRATSTITVMEVAA